MRRRSERWRGALFISIEDGCGHRFPCNDVASEGACKNTPPLKDVGGWRSSQFDRKDESMVVVVE